MFINCCQFSCNSSAVAKMSFLYKAWLKGLKAGCAGCETTLNYCSSFIAVAAVPPINDIAHLA